MKTYRLISACLAIILLIAFAGCEVAPTETPDESPAITPSDYTYAGNWAIVSENPDKPVDVFLLYPTTYQGEATTSEIDDAGMREGALAWYDRAGSAFEAAGNIYMPFYRQMNAMWTLTLPEDERVHALANGANKVDAIAAFEYYLTHYNNGKPFILAGHSQGSSTLKELLFDYFVQHPELSEQMIAAYVIGYSVTTEDLERNPAMKFAEGADDTGVIISWNTVAPGADTENLQTLLPNSLAINPISWTRGDDPAPASENLGSFIDGERVMNIADARVDTELGAVITNADRSYAMPEEMSAAFGTGSFHTQDIGFYYYNLRENAINRARKYLDKGNDTGALYRAAVADAMLIDEEEVLPLIEIDAESPHCTWNSDGQVLMITHHSYPESYIEGEEYTLEHGEVWTFTDREIAAWYGENREGVMDWPLRFKQLIGLPGEKTYTHFSALWVNPDDILRPGYEWELADTTGAAGFAQEPSAEYKAWFDDNIIGSYFDSLYPWTRLGYTYDWAAGGNEYDLSEFLIRENAVTQVEFTKSTDEFLQWLDAEIA